MRELCIPFVQSAVQAAVFGFISLGYSNTVVSEGETETMAIYNSSRSCMPDATASVYSMILNNLLRGLLV